MSNNVVNISIGQDSQESKLSVPLDKPLVPSAKNQKLGRFYQFELTSFDQKNLTGKFQQQTLQTFTDQDKDGSIKSLIQSLERTNFYSGLNKDHMQTFVSIFEPEQISKIRDIVPTIGYRKDDKARICEALNNVQPRQRKQFLLTVKQEYMNLTSKQTNTSDFITISWDQKIEQEYFDEEMDDSLLSVLVLFDPPAMPAGYRLSPIIEILRPEQIFEVLSWFVDDMPSAQYFLFALDRMEENKIWEFFLKVWPMVSKQARVQSLEEVYRFREVNKQQKFLTDQTVPIQILQDIFDGSQVWIKLLNAVQTCFLGQSQVMNIVEKATTKTIQDAMVLFKTKREQKTKADSAEQDISLKLDSIASINGPSAIEQKKRAIQMVWDNITISSREIFTKHRLSNILPQDEPSSQFICLEFFKLLDLDSRVEFIRIKGLDFVERFFMLHENVLDPQERRNVQKELQILQNEVLHHQYFYLNSQYEQANENRSQMIQDDKTLPHLKQLVKEIRNDLHNNWQLVPFEMSGKYLQCLPKPGYPQKFIVLQTSIENSMNDAYSQIFSKISKIDVNDQEGRTYNAMGDKAPQFHNIEATSSNQDNLTSSFGLVSYWQYNQKDGTFDCEHSFATPQIVPFVDLSLKDHNHTYLMKGQNDEIFFFIKEQQKRDQTTVEKTDSPSYDFSILKKPKLSLCIIRNDYWNQSEYEKLAEPRDRFLKSNIEQYEIDSNSELYSLMMRPIGGNKDQFLQNTPPTLIKTSKSLVCVYSYYSKLEGPMIRFYDLFSQNKWKLLGGELFIDFILDKESENDDKLLTRQSDNQGTIYFMSDNYFFVNQGEILTDRDNLRKLFQQSAPIIIKATIDFDCDDENFVTTYVDDIDSQMRSLKFNEKNQVETWHFSPEAIIQANLKRSLNWIKWIKPTKNRESNQFAIATVSHLTLEKSIVIINLSKIIQNNGLTEQQNNITFQVIHDDKTTKVFLISQKTELGQRTVIQTVSEQKDQLQFKFYEHVKGNSDSNPFQLISQKTFMNESMIQYIPQEMSLNDDLSKTAGCFLQKDDLAIHWIHEKLKSPKPGRNSQSFHSLPNFKVEYPILCYDGPFPDGKQITLVNLADKRAARNSLKLNNLKFICFVGHISTHQTSSLCFLAQDYSCESDEKEKEGYTIVHCILNCSRMFQKKIDRNMSDYQLIKEDLGQRARKKDFRKKLRSIVSIEALHNFDHQSQESDSIEQCFVIQTRTAVSVFTHYAEDQGQWVQVSEDRQMQPKVLIRGSDNRFYYVEQQNGKDIVYELHLFITPKLDGNCWSEKWKWTKRPIFELSIGRVIALEIDPVHDKKCYVLKQNSQKGIFEEKAFKNKIFLITDQFQLLQISQNKTTKFYTQKHIQNLEQFSCLSDQLLNLQKEPWMRASIMENCITIQGTTLNFKDEYHWDFDIKELRTSKKKQKWSVYTTQNIDYTNLQILIATFTREDTQQENAFVVKLQPSSRRKSIIGDRRLANVQLIEFVTSEILLIKMVVNNWAMIDTTGQLRQIPHQLLKILNMQNFTQMSAQQLYRKGSLLLLLQAESVTFTVEFSHRGEIIEIYEFPNNSTKWSFVWQNCLSESTLIHQDGLIFRINHVQTDEGDVESDTIEIHKNQGYDTLSKESREDQESFKSIQGSKTIIDIAFIHSQKEFKLIEYEPSTFQICGDYLCWQKGDDKASIQVTNINQLVKKSDKFQGQYFIKMRSQNHLNRIENLPSTTIKLDQYLDKNQIEGKNIHFSAAPISTHLSQRTQNDMDFKENHSINLNLLQVTIEDRAIIFDLREDIQINGKAPAIRDISDMKQFIDPQHYVCTEFNVQNCFSYPNSSKKDPLYRISKHMVLNRSKDFVIQRQKWREITHNIQRSKQIILGQKGSLIELSSQLSKKETKIKRFKMPQKVFGTFKTYSEVDYEELMRIYKCVKQKTAIKKLDFEVLCSLFKGYSVFSISCCLRIFKMIIEQIEMYELSDQQVESNLLRRIYQNIMVTIPKLQNKYQGNYSLSEIEHKVQLGLFTQLEMLTYRDDKGLFSQLMQIAMLTQNVTAICFADTILDMDEIFSSQPEESIQLVSYSFYETNATKRLIQIRWPQNEEFLAYQTDSCLISSEDLQQGIIEAYLRKNGVQWYQKLNPCHWIDILYQKLKGKRQQVADTNNAENKIILQEFSVNTVKVELLDLGWLYADSNGFLDFVQVLVKASENNKQLFDTQFVKTLLDVFWEKYNYKIIWRIFFPYVLYLILSLSFMVYGQGEDFPICDSQDLPQLLTLKGKAGADSNITDEVTLDGQYDMDPENSCGLLDYRHLSIGAIDCFLILYNLIYVEYRQMKQEGFGKYFESIMNIIDLLQYIVNFILIILVLSQSELVQHSQTAVIRSLLVMAMWGKVFDWLRIFDMTSFYISLITQTVKDLIPFFLIFPIFLFTFGTAMFILDIESPSNVTGTYTDYWFFNIIINQYLMSIGSYDTFSTYTHSSQAIMCYVIFILGSFFSTITALNMIIAIMSDTFAKVTESYDQHVRIQQIQILSLYTDHITPSKAESQETQLQFIVYISPTSCNQSETNHEYESSVKSIRETVKKHSDQMHEQFDSKMQEVKGMIVEQNHVINSMVEEDKGYKQKVDIIHKDVKELKELIIANQKN